MRGVSDKSDRMALHPESSEHGAERKIKIEKHRALLDMQFDIRRRVFQFFPGIFYFLEIDSVLLDRVDQTNSVFVFKCARFVHVDLAGAGRRTEQAFAKTRAFFIAPIDETNGDRRL